jgi:cleavage and polyadenylation specificity factor subunit 1
LSIHFYERESHKSLFSDNPASHLFKDQHSRCLILRYYTDIYAILPLRQADDDVDETLDTDMMKPHHPSFVVNASQLEESIAHILDEAFLHEYREPTLAILYSGIRTSTGLLENLKDTVTLLAVTLDLQQRASTTIFSVQNLPYDCFRVLPLPSPVDGLLVLGINQVIHVDQAGRCTSIGVNIYASKSTDFQMTHRPELRLCLEGAVPALVGNEDGDVLLALRDSTFIRLRFIRDGRNVTDIELENVELSSPHDVGMAGFSCAVTLESERIFLGSTTGDSVLLGYTLGSKAIDRAGVSVGMNDIVDDLDEIYGEDGEEGTVGINGTQGKLRLRVHDYLLSTAPIRDATFAVPAFTEVSA